MSQIQIYIQSLQKYKKKCETFGLTRHENLSVQKKICQTETKTNEI